MKLQPEIERLLVEAGASSDGDGGAWVTYHELAQAIYGVEDPVRHQRDAIGRACRTMAAAGKIEIGTTQVYGVKVEVERTRTATRMDCCSGDETCMPCTYGNVPRDLNRHLRETLSRVYGGDEGVLERGELYGVHVYEDRTAEVSYKSQGEYTVTVGQARRLPTEAELEARERLRAKRERQAQERHESIKKLLAA